MAGHHRHQHVEASDDGRTVAAAEVITSGESGRTTRGAVALHRPHWQPEHYHQCFTATE
jgi:hypothetical protein